MSLLIRGDDYPEVSKLFFPEMLGGDDVRRRIKAELLAFGDELQRSDKDLCTQNMIIWQSSFLEAMRHPEPQKVIDAYVPELVNFLEGVPETTPIVRYIVGKMRDRHSLFYSEAFAQRPEPSKESNLEGGASALFHAPSFQADLLASINRVAQEEMEAYEQIEARLDALEARGEQRKIHFKKEIEEIGRESLQAEAAASGIQSRLDQSWAQLSELRKANLDLQAGVQEVRKKINENRSNWKVDVAFAAASIFF